MGMFNPKLNQGGGGGSSVTAKQAATQPNIAGSVANATSSLASIFTTDHENKRVEQEVAMKTEQENRKLDAIGLFSSELSNLSLGIKQGAVTQAFGSAAAQRLYAAAKVANPRLAEDLTKTFKDVMGVSGNLEEEPTLQEKARDSLFKAANDAGRISPDMSDVEIEEAVKGYAKVIQDQNELAHMQKQQTFDAGEVAKQDKIDAKAAKVKAEENKEKMLELSDNIIISNADLVKTQIKTISAQVKAGVMEPDEAIPQMQEQANVVRAKLSRIKGITPERINMIMKTTEEYVAVMQETLKNPSNAKFYESKVKAIEAKEKALILANPKHRRLIVASNLLGNVVTSAEHLNKGFVEMVTGYGEESENSSKKGGKGSLDIVSTDPIGEKIEAVKEITSGFGKALEGTEGDGEIVSFVDMFLEGVDVYKEAVKDVKDYNEAYEYVSSQDFGKLVISGNLNQETLKKATDTLKERYADEILPLMNKKLNDTVVTIGGFVPWFGDVEEDIRAVVDVNFGPTGVSYSPKANIPLDRVGKNKLAIAVKDLNDTLGKKFNQMNRVMHHGVGSTEYGKHAEENYMEMIEGKLPEAKEHSGVDQDWTPRQATLEGMLDAVGMRKINDFVMEKTGLDEDGSYNLVDALWGKIGEFAKDPTKELAANMRAGADKRANEKELASVDGLSGAGTATKPEVKAKEQTEVKVEDKRESKVDIDKEAHVWAKYYNAEHAAKGLTKEESDSVLAKKKQQFKDLQDIEVQDYAKEAIRQAVDTKAFDSELKDLGITPEEVVVMLENVSKIESSGGANNTISSGGAAGILQVIDGTFRDVVERGRVGPKALKALGKTKEELLALSNTERKEYLKNDNKAGAIFGLAAMIDKLYVSKRLDK